MRWIELGGVEKTDLLRSEDLKADCVRLQNSKISMGNVQTAAVIEVHARHVPKNKTMALETYKQSYRYGVGEAFHKRLSLVIERSSKESKLPHLVGPNGYDAAVDFEFLVAPS